MQWSACPTYAMRPATTATSTPSWISAVHTFTSFAPLITVSAGSRPCATAASVCEHSHRGFSQKALIMANSFGRAPQPARGLMGTLSPPDGSDAEGVRRFFRRKAQTLVNERNPR